MDFQLPLLAPSILSADFTKLGEQIQQCTDAGISWIHCDIMDGHFVPNISYGPMVVEAARNAAPDAFLDVHLMIENPDDFTGVFADAGADLITVHYEACTHLHRSIQRIKQLGVMAGVAINPATSFHNIKPILRDVDLVLIMSVNPGFGGQDFIKESLARLKEAANYREEHNLSFLIEVDGGINLKNIQNAAHAGADVLVAGNSIFSAENIPARIEALLEKV